MKKTFVIAMLATLSLAAFLPAKASVRAGDLVKGSGPAVYLVTGDQKRLGFADEQTFRSWYADFGAVRPMSDADLAKLPFDGIALFRPGVRPIRGATDSRVYAVDRDGALRWLKDESVARVIYGDDWAAKVAIVPDPALAAYGRGADVTGPNQYWWKAERDASTSLHEVHVRRLAALRFAAPTPSNGVTLASAVAPKAPTRVIIIPTIVNDNGGAAKEGDVDWFVGESRVMPQEGVNVLPGEHALYHGTLPGYAASAWSGDCTPEGVVNVPADATRACFITFDDIPDNLYGTRANRPPSITLHAFVKNTRGGTLRAQDVKLFIGNMQVANDFASSIAPDDYTLYRVVPPGYSASEWSGDCAAQGTVALRMGDEKTCYITFRD